MRFRGCPAGLSPALALLLFACGGRTFEVVGGDGAVGGDTGPSADSGPGDDGGGDSAAPDDSGGRPDEGVDTGTPPPMCPIPATIAGSGMCTVPGLDCPSAAPIYTCGTGEVTGYASCKCSLGVWVCPPPTCVEAGAPPPSCPAAKLVHEGVACDDPGEDCPGNPTTCGGTQTFYDVFQCTKADLWTRIVATVCDDAG
jgi:hypothetical protein